MEGLKANLHNYSEIYLAVLLLYLAGHRIYTRMAKNNEPGPFLGLILKKRSR